MRARVRRRVPPPVRFSPYRGLHLLLGAALVVEDLVLLLNPLPLRADVGLRGRALLRLRHRARPLVLLRLPLGLLPLRLVADVGLQALPDLLRRGSGNPRGGGGRLCLFGLTYLGTVVPRHAE